MPTTLRVLYVDDEPSLLELGKRALEREGAFTVDTLTSAGEALKRLNTERYDAIISDYQMAEIDGIAFLKQLKKSGNTTPFIIFTGRGREEVVIQALNEGADFYLQKGGELKAQFAELSNKIRYAVTRRYAEEALHETTEYLQNLFSYANAPIITWDPEYHITRFNPAFEHLTGRSEEEVRGKTLDILFPDKTHTTSMALIQTALNGERWETVEIPILTKDGNIRTVIWNSANILDYEGRIVSTIAQGIDITERKETEDALRESEERYRNVVEDQTEFICRFLPDGTHVFVNEAYCRYFGLNREEIIGSRFHPIIHPEDRENVVRLMDSLTVDNPLVTIDQRIIMPDGNTRWQRWSDRAIFYADGSLKEYQSVGRDITEKKKDEEALRESEENFRSLAESSPDYIMRYDRQCRHMYMNPAALRVSGLTEDKIIGKTHRECGFDESQSQFWEDKITIVFETGKPYQTQFEWESVDGPIVLDWMLTPELSLDGTVRSVLGVSRDITQLKVAEEELRSNLIELTRKEQAQKESEARFRLLFNSGRDAIAVHKMGKDGQPTNFIEVNDVTCERLGYTREEMLTLSPQDIDAPDHAGQMPAIIEKLLKTNSVLFETEHIAKDGHRIPVEVSTVLFQLDDSQATISVARDITERKLVEDALQSVQEKYTKAFLASPDAIMISDLKTGVFIEINDATSQIFGYSRDEMIGKSTLELGIWLRKEDRDAFTNKVRTDGRVKRYEALHRHKSGKIFNASISVDTIALDDRVHLISVVRDITDHKISEKALSDASLNWQRTFDSTQDGLFLLDADQRIVMCNRTMQEILGVQNADELTGRYCWEVVHGTAEQVAGCPYLLTQSSLKRETMELKIGDRRYIVVTDPILDEAGKLVGAVHNIRDITERKRTEEALKESERRMGDIINFLPDATIVIDKNGTVLAWNRAIEEMTGVPAEQMIGKANYEYALPFYNERRPITIDLVLHYDPAIVAKYPVMEKEGDSLFSEIFIPNFNKGRGAYLWFTATPLYDAAGNITGAIESIRDITERKLAEEALRKSEERYHNVVEGQTEYICRFLPDGTHIFVNDAYCRYFNKKREEIIGHRFKPVIHPEDRGLVARQLASLTPEAPVKDIDQRIIMPDGSIRWQRWSDRALFDQNGKIIEYQSVGRDITTQKELEAEMANHEKELVQFSMSLAGVNKKLNLLTSITRHDINNQLMILQGYLGLIDDSNQDPSQNEYLQKVKTAAELISEMIRFTQEYEAIGTLAPAWQEARSLVDTAAKQAPLGTVVVENNLPAGAEVFADPLIGKVFYNLVDNAVRHCDTITTIRFSLEVHDGNQTITCEDDGTGIPLDEKERIFERGFGKNTGLGLTLSRDILDITGITIKETGEPGKGARFEMSVPEGAYRFISAEKTDLVNIR